MTLATILKYNECYSPTLGSGLDAAASAYSTDHKLLLDSGSAFDPLSTVHRQANNKGSAKSVSFSKVYVREHCVILGDHPACAMLPLSLGWSHADEQTFDVDIYEQRKLKQRRGQPFYGNRHDMAIRLSFSDRMDVLKRLTGLDYSDIMFLERHRRSCEQSEQRTPI